MICIMSQMYKLHISLIHQQSKVWMTHQIDEMEAIKVWVTCACGFFYNLTVPKPPSVVPGHGTELAVPDILKVPPKEKRKLKIKEKTMEKTTEATKETHMEKCKAAPEEASQAKCKDKAKGKGKGKGRGKKTQKPTHHLQPQATSGNKTY